jgi:hypothetical protein
MIKGYTEKLSLDMVNVSLDMVKVSLNMVHIDISIHNISLYELMTLKTEYK